MARALILSVVVLLGAAMPAAVGRLMIPSRDLLTALASAQNSDDKLAGRIASYYQGSGFPKAGRSLRQKIDEAESFLNAEMPKTGIVGTGAAIVYQDKVVLSKGYGVRESSDFNLRVSSKSLFQIGSVSKTMIAVAIGLLVEENKLSWRDPAKKHLPWLQLYDKYAEAHVRIGDLLAMNSGFGVLPDLADFSGTFKTEREYIEALRLLPPEYSLREQPAYANVNFVILGQLIESVSGMPWDEFLKKRVWEPLGMTDTYASVFDVPESKRRDINAGHSSCNGTVLGPYSLMEDKMAINPQRVRGLNAAGSIVSCADDMAIFIRLLLNKGVVDKVTLLRKPSTIAAMITGKALASAEILEFFDEMGLHYSPDGNTLASGYGIDIVGEVIWGHAYYDKSGDVAGHQTRTGFAPTEDLGVIFMGNTQVPTAHATYALDHFRTYVMGIFLDVPKPVLEFELRRWRAMDKLESIVPGAPVCGLAYWHNRPVIPFTASEQKALVGTYYATLSPDFFPLINITRTAGNGPSLTVAVGKLSGELTSIAKLDDTTHIVVFNEIELAAKFDDNGSVVLDLGIEFRKKGN
ncbi:hypothetical protein PINS_up000359 [Pythium insidiosum]|nr:hypothetical protein PINS_up000359 [Pythium insidiosum]